MGFETYQERGIGGLRYQRLYEAIKASGNRIGMLSVRCHYSVGVEGVSSYMAGETCDMCWAEEQNGITISGF